MEAQLLGEHSDNAVVHDEIRAKRFVLVDDDGQTRAVLGRTEDGRTALMLNDAQGNVGVELQVASDGTRGLFIAEGGVIRGGIAHTPKGIGLLLIDENGRTRAALSLADGQPRLAFPSVDGKPSVEVRVADRDSGLWIFSPDNIPRAGIAVQADSVVVSLFQGQGQRGAEMRISPDGTSAVGLFDEQGNIGWGAIGKESTMPDARDAEQAH